MSQSSEQAQAAAYRERIIDEICYALGVSRNGVMRRLLGPLFRRPAGIFGRLAARADNEVGSSGLGGGARLILPDFSLYPSVRGAENIPVDGPLLVASNHPGALDSIAIMSCIPRKDLKVLLSDVAFFRAFTNAGQYFIYVPPAAAGSMTALRASIDHLKRGGALLIFAHGDVEPDPELSPGASQAIQDWSRSIEIMLHKVPETWLQVTIASGVLMSKFVHNPIIKIRKTAVRRQKLAEVMQICQQMVFPRSVQTHVHISFAKPIRGKDLGGEELMPAVIQMARRLLQDHTAYLGTTP
jgi:1-acyl-sn-glycerol-3-phosphate acyltransferase